MNSVRCHVIAGILIAGAFIPQSGLGPKKQSVPPFRVILNGMRGYIDSGGQLLFTLPSDVYQTGTFSEGMALFHVATPDGKGKVGYIDITGKPIIKPQFARADSFSEGLAPVEINGYAGYVNLQGQVVIEPKFWPSLQNMRFSESLAAVEVLVDTPSGRVHRTGYINRQGEFVIHPQFIEAFPFKEERAIISDKKSSSGGRYGYIDKSGKTIIPIQFARASDFSEGLAMVMVEQNKDNTTNKVGYIDKSGTMIINPTYDDFYVMDMNEAFRYDILGTEGMFSEGLASAKMNGKWGYINRTGQFVINPQFAYAGIFKEGLAPAAIKNSRKRMYGFINRTGHFVIQPQFDSVREFNYGLAEVLVFSSRGEFDKAGYINKTGKYVWKPTK